MSRGESFSSSKRRGRQAIRLEITEDMARRMRAEAEAAAAEGKDEFRACFDIPPEAIIKELERQFPTLNDD